MKYYSVIARFYDDGRVVATMGESVEANEMPKNTWRELARFDIYTDWFESREKALAHLEEAKRA